MTQRFGRESGSILLTPSRTRFLERLHAGSRIVDVGCGDGQRTRAMQQACPGMTWTGVDLEPPPPDDGAVTWVVGDITETWFPSHQEQVDAITCLHVLEHLTPRELSAVTTAVRSWLRSGGLVYVEVPDIRTTWYPSWDRLFPSKPWGADLSFWDNPTHVRPFSSKALRAVLTMAGCEVVDGGIVRDWRWKTSVWPFLWRVMRRDRRALYRILFNTLGWARFIVGRRHG